jgi:hypothetical protein
VQNFLLEDVSFLNQPPSVLETAQQSCQAFWMQKAISAIVKNPTARAAVLIVLVVPISFYLGTTPVRRGILYYAGVFAPSLVAAIGAGLSAWSWKWFWVVLLICAALTALIQTVMDAL